MSVPEQLLILGFLAGAGIVTLIIVFGSKP